MVLEPARSRVPSWGTACKRGSFPGGRTGRGRGSREIWKGMTECSRDILRWKQAVAVGFETTTPRRRNSILLVPAWVQKNGYQQALPLGILRGPSAQPCRPVSPQWRPQRLQAFTFGRESGGASPSGSFGCSGSFGFSWTVRAISISTAWNWGARLEQSFVSTG